jgi:hypothetical protein
MPFYNYMCSVCGENKEIIKSMRDDTVPECCGQKMLRDYKTDLPFSGNHEYGTPLHSDSLAIAPSQVEEHKRLFPDVALDSQCCPILTSVGQHDKYIKTRGYEKLEQRHKRRATRVM